LQGNAMLAARIGAPAAQNPTGGGWSTIAGAVHLGASALHAAQSGLGKALATASRIPGAKVIGHALAAVAPLPDAQGQIRGASNPLDPSNGMALLHEAGMLLQGKKASTNNIPLVAAGQAEISSARGDAAGMRYAAKHPGQLLDAIGSNPVGAAESVLAPAENNIKHGRFAAAAGDMNYLFGTLAVGGKGTGSVAKAATEDVARGVSAVKTANAVRRVARFGEPVPRPIDLTTAVRSYISSGWSISDGQFANLWRDTDTVINKLKSTDPATRETGIAMASRAINNARKGYAPYGSVTATKDPIHVVMDSDMKSLTNAGFFGLGANAVGVQRLTSSTGQWAPHQPQWWSDDLGADPYLTPGG
jgi:hypothetical protein